MDMSHADRMDTSSSRTSSSPVFFYSPRVPRKQQQQQLGLHHHHSSRITNPHVASPTPPLDDSLCDTRFQSTRPSTITLSTFAADRKTAGQQSRRSVTKDCWSIRRAECVPLLLQEPDNSCDKIAMSGTANHTHAVCDDDCRILVPNPLPSSSSSKGSDARNKPPPQQQPLLSLDQMSCKKNNSVETFDQRQSHSPSISSSAQTPGSPVSRSSNALLCPELEHEMEKLDSLIDYINSGLEALINDDEENRVATTTGQGCDCSQSVTAGNKPGTASAGVSSHSLPNKSRESLINHCKDQQEPIPSLTTSSTCDRLKFCVKSLHDSADTVIDGSSSKDVSSSADGCSEHDDGLSKEDVTVTSDDDELVDEGFQCNSADQMIPFNHLTVLQIEAFLKKHRRTDPLKDEGKDSILFFPDFIRDVMAFLIKHGLKKEGIFRRSGVKSRINLLMNSSQVNGGNNNINNNSSSLNQSQETILDEACAYDVADFLKGWFRNQDPLLSAPLVTSLLPLITRCESRSGQLEEGSDMNALRANLLLLPNRLALEALLRFLFRFASMSEYNSMTVSNLVVVWTPSICREGSQNGIPVNGTASPHHPPFTSQVSASILESVSSFMKDARTVLQFLLQNTKTVFSIPRNELEELQTTSTRIPNSGPCVPAIRCRSSKVMSASPYEIFLRIIINRSAWDPLVISATDEGECQRIRHSFSRFVPTAGSIRIRRKLSSRPLPTDETIQIHEESIDGGQIYTCDWLITSSESGVSNYKSSEVTLSLFHDLKGRPLIWYKKSFPHLLEVYLNSINSSFPSSGKSDRSSDRSIAPFSCCFFMRQAVNA